MQAGTRAARKCSDSCLLSICTCARRASRLCAAKAALPEPTHRGARTHLHDTPRCARYCSHRCYQHHAWHDGVSGMRWRSGSTAPAPRPQDACDALGVRAKTYRYEPTCGRTNCRAARYAGSLRHLLCNCSAIDGRWLRATTARVLKARCRSATYTVLQDRRADADLQPPRTPQLASLCRHGARPGPHDAAMLARPPQRHNLKAFHAQSCCKAHRRPLRPPCVHTKPKSIASGDSPPLLEPKLRD